MTAVPRPSVRDRLRLALLTGHDVRTIERAYFEGRAHAGTIARIARAARELGIKPPSAARELSLEHEYGLRLEAKR